MRIIKEVWKNDSEPIIAIMIVLLVFGTINVASASFALGTQDYNNPHFFLLRQLVWVAVSIGVFLVCRKIPYYKWRPIIFVLFLIVSIALVLVLFIGPAVNGSQRWIIVGPLSFQPSELAKLLSIMMAAASLSSYMRRNKPASIFNGQFVLIAVMAALTEREPDLGTAVVICAVPLLMAVIVGLRRWILMFLGSVGAALFAFMVISQPYRLERVMVMLNPEAYAQDEGFQIMQSLATIGSGGLFGMGLGDGVSKYFYLPEAHTDFAFAIFCQEHGFVGALLVLALFALLTMLIARVAGKARDEFGQVLALGIMLLIMGQAIVNLLMVAGFCPVVGVPLPFISYGGSSLMVTMAAIGIVVNISDVANADRHRNPENTPPQEGERRTDMERIEKTA